MSRWGIAMAILCGALAAAGTAPRAADDPATAPPRESASEKTAPRPPVFVPPKRGAPKTRVGGATRGKQAPGTASLQALVPEDGGLTVAAQPVLYWYLSETTSGRVDVTIVDETSVAPLLEATIQGPVAAGVHPIRLADHAVTLAPGINYQWFVALIPDAAKRSNDVIAGGGIERIPPSDALQGELAAADAPTRPAVLAGAGLWYDAFDAVSQTLEKSPGDTEARSSRAALLDQVGLTEVARAEREAASAR